MAKSTPLVCQYLEKISRSALEKYQQSIREYVRHRHGVYALYKRNRLYYVGLAGNLRTRLHHHLRDRHGESWDRFSVYLTIGDRHIKELESLILRIVRPPGNKQAGKFPKAENLLRQLGKEIRDQQRREWQEVMGRSSTKKQKLRTKTSEPVRKGRQPVLAKYKLGPTKLKAKYKGRTVQVRVRKDGTISFQGKVYNSPSLAGRAVLGRTPNGWTFWTYERAPGDWVSLNTLRR